VSRTSSSSGRERRPGPREAAALLHALRENGRLLAELAERSGAPGTAPPAEERTVRGPGDVAAYLAPEMVDLEQEQLRVVLLDTKNTVRRVVLVYQGTANCTRVRLAECFREAVREGATALVLVHNHPSGWPEPSPEDVRLTAEAARAGELLGIEVLDHVVLARAGFRSLRAAGLYTPRPTGGEAAERPRAGWTADGADRPAPVTTGHGADADRGSPGPRRREPDRIRRREHAL
jgi:DNA repair protein RadC